MATRTTRNQPFCWQEKKVLRLLRNKFSGAELVKYKALYLTLTEIDSDSNGQPIKFYTKTIATYSGLSVKWIPGALQILRELEAIAMPSKFVSCDFCGGVAEKAMKNEVNIIRCTVCGYMQKGDF